MKLFKWITFTIVVTMISLSAKVSAEIRITAGHLKKTVDSLAVTFAADAKLALVSCYEMDTTGKSSVWSYVYLSADSSKEYHFLAQNNQVSFNRSEEIRVGIGILIEPWIDSDSALSVAELEGGSDIREWFPFCGIAASLVRPIAPPFHCLWEIEYRLSGSVRTILINAANGEVVTSVPATDDRGLPIQYWLHQNYPNPFNPLTNITFSLPSRSYASLKIYNVIGREIATLVSEELSAGNHSKQWNAENIPSGVYFYRLTCGLYSETKKLILLK